MDVVDIKEKVEEMVDQLVKDKALQTRFQKDPVKVVESLLGVDLPDEAVGKIVQGVKSRLSIDQLADAAEVIKRLLKS